MTQIRNILLIGERSDYTSINLCHYALDRQPYTLTELLSRTPEELGELDERGAPDLILLLPSDYMLQQFRTLRLRLPDTKILVIGSGDALLQFAPYLIGGAAGYMTVNEIGCELSESISDVSRRGLVANRYVQSALTNLTLLLDKDLLRIAGLMKNIDSREKLVLRHLRDFPGISCEVLASRLCLSTHTVKKRVHIILQKLHVQNRIELQHYLGLYRPEGSGS